MADHHDTEKGKVTLGQDGIVEIGWVPGAELHEADVEELLVLMAEVAPRRRRVLVHADGVRSISRRALVRTTNHPGVEHTLCVAILVGSPVSRMLGNFFLSVSRPDYPTSLFTAEPDARGWLLEVV